MEPPAERWHERVLVTLVLVGFGVFILWPTAAGTMPVSADHPVHMTRAMLRAQAFADGRLYGWSDAWFAGMPAGEFYPPLGDLLVIAVKAIGLGRPSWPTAYAIGFTIAFIIPALAIARAGRALGMGPLPGLVAGLVWLSDPGAAREGGWAYSVWLGVWAQALATGLTWWGLAVLSQFRSSRTQPKMRPAVRGAHAGLILGFALLAHPITMPVALLGAGLMLGLTLVRRRAEASHLLLAIVVAAGVALGVAAFWLVPMLNQRGWMMGWGEVYNSIDVQFRLLGEGHWTWRMAPTLGFGALAGMLVVSVRSNDFARFAGLFAIVLWLLACRESFWTLRLDRIAGGFEHLTYQRFLLTAKPGLYLLFGLVVASMVQWSRRLRDQRRRAAGLLVAVLVAAGLVRTGQEIAQFGEKAELGQLRELRNIDDPEADANLDALDEFLRDQVAQRGPLRVAVFDHRNRHWAADLPVRTGVHLYKIGFTPGQPFVHQPAAFRRGILDALNVQLIIFRSKRHNPPGRLIATFGPLHVYERPFRPHNRVRLEGPGTLTMSEELIHLDGHEVRATVHGTGPGSRIVFAIAAHPRWELLLDGQPLSWFEVPITGKAPPVDPATRSRGELRDHSPMGNDGTEPIFIAADLPADGELVLRYQSWRTRDVVAAMLSSVVLLGALALLGAAWRRHPRVLRGLEACDRGLCAIARKIRPIWLVGLAGLMVLAVVLRWRAQADADASHVVSMAERGEVVAQKGFTAGPMRVMRRLRPSMRVSGYPKPLLELRPPPAGTSLTGWVGLHDRFTISARKGSRRFIIEGQHENGQWIRLFLVDLPHRPQLHPIDIPASDLAWVLSVRVRVESKGKAPPPIGFDLWPTTTPP